MENCSLFDDTFLDGKVEAKAMADQGADVYLLTPEVCKQLRQADPSIECEVLDNTVYFTTVDKSAVSLPCSRRVKLTISLKVRHAAALRIRNVHWYIADRPIVSVIIGRNVLRLLGLDNHTLLAAAYDRVKGEINAEEEDPPSEGSIASLLQDNSSTFHSFGSNDENESVDLDRELVVDIGRRQSGRC